MEFFSPRNRKAPSPTMRRSPSVDYRSRSYQHLALNIESSMSPLDPAEEFRIQTAVAHYHPQILALGGLELAFQSLVKALATRYEMNPAYHITETLEPIPLPLLASDFKALSLDECSRESALRAYYQHPIHTAFRYLSKPNHWISPDAEHTQYDPQNPNLQWAAFEEHIELIVTQWLAASDINFEPLDGFSLEGRIEHFINELAMTGRAHNWDQRRIKASSDETLTYDLHDNLLWEDYDDLQADKPSCSDGVRARLYQAVLGHAFFIVPPQEQHTQSLLNQSILLDPSQYQDIVLHVLHTYIHDMFQSAIERLKPSRRLALQTAWHAWLEGTPLDTHQDEQLNKLNISDPAKEYFFLQLPNEYLLFKTNPALIDVMRNHMTGPDNGTEFQYAKQFGQAPGVNLSQLLRPLSPIHGLNYFHTNASMASSRSPSSLHGLLPETILEEISPSSSVASSCSNGSGTSGT
jgi:hypothetical protein